MNSNPTDVSYKLVIKITVFLMLSCLDYLHKDSLHVLHFYLNMDFFGTQYLQPELERERKRDRELIVITVQSL